MKPEGYNPLRWNCDKSGCYNHALRPKIEVFADCFPRKIAMSDIDGAVEVNGRFLFLEWKSDGGALTTGQRIMFERLTSLSPDPDLVQVIVVTGDAKTMQVHSVERFIGGVRGGPYSYGLDELKARITEWSDCARWNKRHVPLPEEHAA